jgi:AcrR family transcriptional regulator
VLKEGNVVNIKAMRGQIIEAADQLFYRQGFTHTSFSNIAGALQISKGNLYHHFKSKNDILDAVISERLQNTRTLLQAWEDSNETPEGRIRCYIHILLTNSDKILRYGCPVGTLCNELAKLDYEEKTEAVKIFDLFRAWLGQQFIKLGYKDDADRLAMRVLAWSQGVATLANAYDDKAFVHQEVSMMCAWLETYIKNTDRPQHTPDTLN